MKLNKVHLKKKKRLRLRLKAKWFCNYLITSCPGKPQMLTYLEQYQSHRLYCSSKVHHAYSGARAKLVHRPVNKTISFTKTTVHQ